MNSKPIDFVMIWVDGNDPEWQKEKSRYDGKTVTASNSAVRYRDWDNLQYWFRGVEKFAPWVNKIHFVTWGHIPPWLDTSNPKINIVNHKDYIPEEYLPTFSSHTIELNLHRIEGLAEQFVYFNDDMFITAPTKPEDFFKDGKPCDVAALDCIFFGKDSAGSFNGADITIINSRFKKKRALKENWKKWYNLKNGFRNVVKSVLLYPWPWFPGLLYQHACNSFLKSTFEEVWSKEFEALDETCSHRFRKSGDLNQWVMKFWQLAEGNFEVRREDFAYCYHVKESNFKALCKELPSGKRPLICINDTANTKHFEEKKQTLIEVFEGMLPEASSFEKADYYKTQKTAQPVVIDKDEENREKHRLCLLETLDFLNQTISFAQSLKCKKLSTSRQYFTTLRIIKSLKTPFSPVELIGTDETKKYLSALKKVLALIEPDVLAKVDASPYYKLFLASLKTGKQPEIVSADGEYFVATDDYNKYSLCENNFKISHFSFADGKAKIEGVFSGYTVLPDDTKIGVILDGKVLPCVMTELDDTREVLGIKIQRKFAFSTEINLENANKANIQFFVELPGARLPINSLVFGKTSPFSNKLTKSYCFGSGYVATAKEDKLLIQKGGRFLCELKLLCQIIKRNRSGAKMAVAARLFYAASKPFIKKPIVIIESGEDVENGRAAEFFKYLKASRPELNAMFVVPEGYKSLKTSGVVLEKESRRYKRKILLSSAIVIENPENKTYNPFRRRFGFYKNIVVNKPLINLYSVGEGESEPIPFELLDLDFVK